MYRNDVPGNGIAFASTSLLADDIADQIALAGHPAEIDEVVKEAWGHHTNGRLTENDMEAIDEATRARRTELGKGRPPPGPKPIGTVKSKLALGWPRRTRDADHRSAAQR